MVELADTAVSDSVAFWHWGFESLHRHYKYNGNVMELVYMTDLKSVAKIGMRVRIPPLLLNTLHSVLRLGAINTRVAQ